MHEAPLLCFNETGCMLSCAYFTIVRGVELHCCCAPETKCYENASVCSCCGVCERERERSGRQAKFCQLSSWSREKSSELGRVHFLKILARAERRGTVACGVKWEQHFHLLWLFPGYVSLRVICCIF